jgi:Fibronectin type III domain
VSIYLLTIWGDPIWCAPAEDHRFSTHGLPRTKGDCSYDREVTFDGERRPINTGSTDTSYTVTGLTVGTPYTFTVAATNAVGTGSPSGASASITPVPQAAPDAPSSVLATAYDGAAQLYWGVPDYDGGAPITGYRVTPYVNGVAETPVTTSSADPERYISGLKDGTAYTFTVAAINQIATGSDSAPSTAVTPTASQTSYTSSVFSDGFESGSLSAWDGPSGTGTATVTNDAAHNGAFGAQLSNAPSQYELIIKTFSSPITDTATSFWARVGSGGGIQELAEARDPNSSQTVWSVIYDPGQQGLYLYPFNGAGTSTEIFTGTGAVPTNTWFKVEVRYNADANGGAQLYVDGQTQPGWSVSGNYARSDNFQKLQLWNDSTTTTYFDDAQVATIPPSSNPGGGNHWKQITPAQLILFTLRLDWACHTFHQGVCTPIWYQHQTSRAAMAAAASAASQALAQIVQSKQGVPPGSAISALYGSLDSLSATLGQLASDLQNGQSYTADLQAAQAEIAGICKEALATGVGMVPSN